MLLHRLEDFKDLIAVTAREQAIDPGLVEKDYWIMQCLWGLQQAGFRFKLKGGTSLSKGFGLINRFSEDIDILIHPEDNLPVGRNQNKTGQIAARQAFFDRLAGQIRIDGIVEVFRDTEFDDVRHYRGAGIRLVYEPLNPLPKGLKTGILLEAGFDQVSPNRPCTITSWAYEKAIESGIEGLTDNRALNVRCYEPGYTLVEKLQTISTKYRLQRGAGGMPVNFMRHYYDVYCLLADPSVVGFIGTEAYNLHKMVRFRQADNPDLTRNEAFILSDEQVRELYENAYTASRALYYRDTVTFDEILNRIGEHLGRL